MPTASPGHQKKRSNLIKSRNHKVPNSQRPRLEHPHEHELWCLTLSLVICPIICATLEAHLHIPNSSYRISLMKNVCWKPRENPGQGSRNLNVPRRRQVMPCTLCSTWDPFSSRPENNEPTMQEEQFGSGNQEVLQKV